MFNTNPKAHKKTYRTTKSKYFEYTDSVVRILNEMGIPYEKAQLVVIDLRNEVLTEYKKLTPEQTCKKLLPTIKDLYGLNK